jgi:hypothetical protein
MFAELSYFQKLWNRGVDIGVGVVTSVIVGVIGLLFWRGKLWLDLRAAAEHQRQQHQISAELDAERAHQAARERRAQLQRDRENFAVSAEAAEDFVVLARSWESFAQWLYSNGLNDLPGNLRLLHVHGNNGQAFFQNATHGPVTEKAQEVAALIRTAEL